MADRIVALLLNDPGTARSSSVSRFEPEAIVVDEPCKGCGRAFDSKRRRAQFCSRDCYDQHLERKRVEKRAQMPAQEKVKVERKPPPEDAVGTGRAFAGEPAAYCYSRIGVSAPRVQAEIQALYGVRPGTTTIYRCWSRKAPPYHKGSLPTPPLLPTIEIEKETKPLKTPREPGEAEAQLQTRLRAALAKLDIVQGQAAQDAGVDRTTFSFMVAGKVVSENAQAKALAWLETLESNEGPVQPEDLPEISELPLAVLKQVATSDAVSRGLGLETDTLPDLPKPVGFGTVVAESLQAATDASPSRPDPGQVFLAKILEEAARSRLAELAPEMSDQVDLGVTISWKVSA